MDHWTRPGLHWHAYLWTGTGRPDDKQRRNPLEPVPPLEVMHWLRKSPEQMKLTSSDPTEVLAWLEERLKENPPLDGYLHEPSWLDGARESLARFPGDVVWGFYTVGQQYRSIAAVSCPRTFNATSETLPLCPLGRPAA